MAKALVLGEIDADPGVDDNNISLLLKVLFVGATVPGTPLIDQGALGNGIPVPLNFLALSAAAYSNAVEAAVIARAAELGFVLVATDVLFHPWTRGT